MDPTTLVTFLFQAPAEARTVELLGSWDNFNQPYRMHHDRRRGQGFWTGCFKFHNIIFDGDRTQWSKPRTGGLKQGGVYWYYYRLNDEVEAFDDAKENTTNCPLLPGQRLNIIEVPVEIIEPPTRCRSATVDVIGTLTSMPRNHTLDPGDKFVALAPPPISKVHGRSISDLALNGRLETTAHTVKSPPVSPPTTTHSNHKEVSPAPTKSSGRYYAAGAFAEDRESTSSRRSWHSAGPSFAHSSIIDAYGVDEDEDEEEDESSMHFSFPNVPSPKKDASSDLSFDLHVDENYIQWPTAADDDFDRLYLASQHGSTNWDGEPAYDDLVDFEGGQGASSGGDAEPPLDERFETSSHGPQSIQNVQMYGSRPTTSHGTEHWRPRLYTLPSERLLGHTVHDSNSHLEQSPRSSEDQSMEAKSEPCDSVRNSAEHGSEADNAAYDVLSPTFSAATVSTGGLNTPFRLSISCGYSRTASSNATHNDESLETVAERLRSLSSDSNEGGTPSSMTDRLEVASFTGYALPESESVSSPRSLAKLSSTRTSVVEHDTPLQTLIPERNDTSFADSIFSELGYLGGSIA